MRQFFINSLFITILSLYCHGQQPLSQGPKLMPWPQEVTMTSSDFEIKSDFRVFVHGETGPFSRISKASVRFIRYMTDKSGVFVTAGFPESIETEASSAALNIYFDEEVELLMGTDESYTLKVDSEGIEIRAKTDIGAMHGLTTLKQLITVRNGAYVFEGTEIKDAPRFIWRGIMMDVARHFMPVEVVKRNLDAMAYVKLNVFHWHLSDDQGFRVETKTLPELVEKASDGQYYTQEQIRDIVTYAEERGIRVVPEFDVPGHATAFLTAYPELGSKKGEHYSLERFSGIFDPTLDPTNEETYIFLDKLFREVTPLFPDPYFHIGGDENEAKQWRENEGIQKFMKDNDLKDKHELQTYFNVRVQKILSGYGKSLMGWEEIMTDKMPKSALIHSWRGVNEGVEPGQSLVEAAKKGYQTILSNGYYINLLLPVEEHYLVDPMPEAVLTEEESHRILGGEATMWSELVTPLTIDICIWPRTAAIAERFWSRKEIRDLDSMHDRLKTISENLDFIGIRHLSSKALILRNIANYQDTHALNTLSNISEPFKIYSRNAEGIQYKTFSPFTLFADACTVDAMDARPFSKAVDAFVTTRDISSKDLIIGYLNKWKQIDLKLSHIEPKAPLVSRIRPYSKRLTSISSMLLLAIQEGKMTAADTKGLKGLLDVEEDPNINLDVELAIKEDLLKLAEFLTR